MKGRADLTLGRILTSVLEIESDSPAGLWPPDLFGAISGILKLSGGYRAVSDSDFPHQELVESTAEFVEKARDLAGMWVRAWETLVDQGGKTNTSVPMPPELAQRLQKLCAQTELPLDRMTEPDHAPILHELLLLNAICDEACGTTNASIRFDMARYLGLNHNLNAKLPSEFAQIFPKSRVPETGLSLRSIARHLAVVFSNDARVRWTQLSFNLRSRTSTVSALLIPWPEELPDTSFSVSADGAARGSYFSFAPPSSRTTSDALIERIRRAIDQRGEPPSLIVLPEASINEPTFNRLATEFASTRSTLIAGVSTTATTTRQAQNRVFVDTLAAKQRIEQSKHHRWRLDPAQISMYGLQHHLQSGAYWEDMAVKTRELNLFRAKDQLTFVPLICEDLARTDPVGDLVRALAPTLVVALLQDGAQIPARWSGRYAQFYAEDPGCSTLTLTSIGMAMRARLPSRQIALFTSPAGAQSILLEPGDHAVWLELSVDESSPSTLADGRAAAPVHTLHFAEQHSLRLL